jgi:catechol 2,3-dioxygenase
MDAVAERSVRAETMRIGGAGLVVRDLAACLAFYRDAIGLSVLSADAAGAVLGAGGVGFLELIHRPDALEDDPRAAGLFHTAFLLPSRADLADWLAHALTKRVRLEGASDHSVSEAIYLSDPEGNGVEIYADRARALWSWQGGEVAMGTARLDLDGLIAAHSAHGWRGAPAGTRIGHVHLRVGDVATARRFWMEQVGLDLVRGMPSAAFLSSGGYHHHIAANTWQSQGAGPRDPRRAGLAYVALAVDGAWAGDRAGVLVDPWGTEIRRGVA